MTRFLIPLIALVLTGCATTTPLVTSDMLYCMPAPISPTDDPAATEADVGEYVIDLAEAGADCRSKLGSVRQLILPETKFWT